MSPIPYSPLGAMVARLQLREAISPEDAAAVLALPCTIRALDARAYIVWDGDRPQYSCLLLVGYAIRHKVVGDGGRQILSLHVRGDMVDLQNSLLGHADHSVEMLTAGAVALIPVEAIRRIAIERPMVGMAMWYDTLVEGAIAREWITNLGRRDARTRIAHMLCEFALRFEIAGLGDTTEFQLPMTQEQLADATGLTPIHVNRTLKMLATAGLITRTKRTVRVEDWPALARVGDFNPAYLHLGRDRP